MERLLARTARSFDELTPVLKADEANAVFAALQEKHQKLEEKFQELEHVYCEVLCHVTNGRMSKPYLDAGIVKLVCDDVFNERYEEFHNALTFFRDEYTGNEPSKSVMDRYCDELL